MEQNYNKHYITVDERGRIVDGFSDAFRKPEKTDICINETGGYQFRLFPGGKENPSICMPKSGVPIYHYKDGAVARRTAEEINADVAVLPDSPSRMDMLEAQATYTAMMTDTLLEV